MDDSAEASTSIRQDEPDFTQRFEQAIKSHEPLVQQRGEAEKRFPDYKKAEKYKKFKEVADTALNKPGESLVLHASFKNAQYIIKNFEVEHCRPTQNETCDVTNGNTQLHIPETTELAANQKGIKTQVTETNKNLVPTLTFGDMLVPARFSNHHDPLDTECCHRKYILLSEKSSAKKICELLIGVWDVPMPRVVLSFTGGNTDKLTEEARQTFATNVYKFCKSTGVWILSDGMHSGVSRLLGRIFQSDLEPDVRDSDLEFQKNVTLLGICDWEKIGDKTLLHGISLENDYSSVYFYPKELVLEYSEVADMLNPFQQVYILAQKRDGSSLLKMRNNMLECFVKKTIGVPVPRGIPSDEIEGRKPENIKMLKMSNETVSDIGMFGSNPESTVIPVVTFVVGGDSHTLEQVRISVKSNFPVVIVPQSGEIPDCLADIYKKLEIVNPRSCNRTPGLNPEEEAILSSLLGSESCKCLFKEQNESDVRHNVDLIMRHRYYLTIMNLDQETSEDFTNVVRSIYKPYRQDDCINIALQTNSLTFLKAIFKREVDPEFVKESGFADADGLTALHKANLYENADVFEISNFIEKHKKGMDTDESILPMVGRIMFYLVGYKYSLLYQVGSSSLDKELANKPRDQFWHLFLYAVLANKPQFADYFLSLTRCPLAGALFAYKMFLGMATYATRGMENEKAVSFQSSAEHFEELAVKLLDEMYRRSPKEAYISLTREAPFNLGPYVTPLSLAADAKAMNVIKSTCCQTYLQRVWMKNMLLNHEVRMLLPILSVLPGISIPMVFFKFQFKETKMPSQYVTKQEEDGLKRVNKCCDPGLSCTKPGGCWWKLKSFYTAPITKYNLSMILYIVFLGLLSYLFLTKLQPVHSVGDISVVEWLCYTWCTGFLVQELSQLVDTQDTGPLYHLKSNNLSPSVWPLFSRWCLHLRLYNPILYLKDGSWNSLDIFMLSFLVVTTLFRFKLPDEDFQMVRVLYSVAIILCFFRSMRYFSVLRVIGPRIIAIQMMFIELLMFLVILGVFLLSFGVAFQGLLHPQQPPSLSVLADVLWRPYWSMFGQLYIDDEDKDGMGRDVSNSSCTKAQASGSQQHTNCYSSIPIILMGVYLFISNILLLNLLIAIFGNTLNKVEDVSATHWSFQQYHLVHEYYYRPWTPPPLNIVWHLVRLAPFICSFFFNLVTRPRKPCCCKRKKDDDGHIFPNDHFRMNSVLMDALPSQVDPAQKKAYSVLRAQNAIQV